MTLFAPLDSLHGLHIFCVASPLPTRPTASQPQGAHKTGHLNVYLDYDRGFMYLEHKYQCFRGWEAVVGAAEEREKVIAAFAPLRSLLHINSLLHRLTDVTF